MDTSAGISLRPTATLLCALNGGDPVTLARAKGYREYNAPTRPPTPTPKRGGLSGLLGRLAGATQTVEADDGPFPFKRAGALLQDLMVATPAGAPTKVCIAVPAWANDAQRQIVVDGARTAGWEVLALANESTAAAMASGAAGHGDGATLVYDLSDERFDVSIIAIRGIEFEVLAADGLTGIPRELALADRLARTEAPCQRALKYAGLSASAIDTVVLVGETMREQPARQYVARLFDKEPLARFDPEEVVGFGAAVQAGLLELR